MVKPIHRVHPGYQIVQRTIQYKFIEGQRTALLSYQSPTQFRLIGAVSSPHSALRWQCEGVYVDYRNQIVTPFPFEYLAEQNMQFSIGSLVSILVCRCHYFPAEVGCIIIVGDELFMKGL
jgi:hypothetical protein